MKAFESIRLNALTLPNRLVMAPVKTAFGSSEGKVTDTLLAYYSRRAKGGVGTIIVEPLYVDGAGKEHPKQLGIDVGNHLDGLHRLVSTIHAGGARAFAHLNHAGRAANPKATGLTPEAPSEMVCPSTGVVAREMDEARIQEIVQAFVHAAWRAKWAKFDGVELQCGLGYLVAQFYSPKTNHRQDGYGGSRERRARFAQEVVKAVRKTLGPDMPLIARISATEQVDGGLDLKDGQDLARRLVSWGIDALHVVSGSACDTPPWYYQHMSLPEGKNELFAAGIRKGLDIPVIVAGRLGDPDRIAGILADGQADMVALGRPLVADPDLPRKMREGRTDKIMLCGGCLQGCLVSVKAGEGLSCIVNPEVGHEAETEPAAKTPRHVVVIGGGPAGLMAAIVARRRGHSVTLLEKGELGGQFALSYLAPGKEAMQRPLSSLLHWARRSGADIRTGMAADVDAIIDLAPGVVVLATGAKPIMPVIPGLVSAVTGEEALNGNTEIGDRVLGLWRRTGGYRGCRIPRQTQQKSSCRRNAGRYRPRHGNDHTQNDDQTSSDPGC